MSEEKQNKLMKLTVKELKAKAVELGMPEKDVESFDKKKPLIATIEALKATRVDKVTTLEPKVDTKQEQRDERRWRTKAERMRAKLEKQQKVRILLPLDPNEKQGIVREVTVKGRKEYVHVGGAIETVQLNGYKTIIPKGVYFDVPQQVADVLAESYRQTQDAGKDFLVDRDKNVREVLN